MADLITQAGIRQFLLVNPAMALQPSTGDELRIQGLYRFGAAWGGMQVVDAYELAIEIPARFPKEIPRIEEIGGRIPRRPDFHVNPEGSLCLGSPLRLLVALRQARTLQGFLDTCLVPYLFAVSHRLSHGGNLLFGELPHGRRGELEDCSQLFGLRTPREAIAALHCLGLRRRVANKRPCPCQCGARLGRCALHLRLLPFRPLASRAWFRSRAHTA